MPQFARNLIIYGVERFAANCGVEVEIESAPQRNGRLDLILNDQFMIVKNKTSTVRKLISPMFSDDRPVLIDPKTWARSFRQSE